VIGLKDGALEHRSLRDLRRIVEEAERWDIKIALIGGYAVQAYTRGYRFTKDIDLVTTRESEGRLRALLRSLNYKPRETEFGLAGSKHVNGDSIDLHISIGRILDISTGHSFPVTDELFKETNNLPVHGYYKDPSQLEVEAPIVSLETLLTLKLMPVGRDKDAIDVMALLTDTSEKIEIEKFANICKTSNLTEHITTRIRKYAEKIRTGQMEKIWLNTTGLRLPYAMKRKIMQLLRKALTSLRK